MKAGRGIRWAVLACAVVVATPAYGKAVAAPRCGSTEQLAFVSNRDGDEEIFVLDTDGSEPRQLTRNGVYDGHPIWSPDGEWIAFDRVTGEADLTDEDAPHDVFVVRADGTGERNVTKTPQVHEGTPAWSPDGQRIAFHTRRDGDFEIYAVDLDGANWENLTNNHPRPGAPDATGRAGADLKPSWAADGRIVFESYRDEAGLNSDIWVIETNGTQHALVETPFPTAEWFPSWSPDGTHVAYMSGGDGRPFDIYTVRDDRRDVTNVTRTPKTEDNPSWSPDGRRIAFGSNLGDGGLDTRVYAAEWYQSGGGTTDNFEIYTARADGTGLTRLTDHPALDTDPSYRPRRMWCRFVRPQTK